MKRGLILLLLIMSVLALYSCGKKSKDTGNVEIGAQNSPGQQHKILLHNVEMEENLAQNRTPCDTISLQLYVIHHYSAGSYLLYNSKVYSNDIPRPAVIYVKPGNETYVFGIVAKSKPGERFIEPKNIIGYEESFINFDSTNLGTAFPYLTLFHCDIESDSFDVVWQAPVPSHGGFNDMLLERWNYDGTPYIKIDFFDATRIGHIDYNYFLINGLTEPPHLLMTYKGLLFWRTLGNVNNDAYPDYYEHIIYNLKRGIVYGDSVAFVWNKRDSVYVNTRNHRQTRPY